MAPESFLASILALNSISSDNHISNNNCNNSSSSPSAAYVSADGIADAGTRLSDGDLATRRAEEAASRRYQAAGWLRKMVGVVGSKDLPNEPSEEEFRLGLRNGLILCNVINKVHPGSVPKVVDNPASAVPPPDGAALSAYQYFENVRNFLVAVQELNLPNFEASDLEKGGSSTKVVDCILALKSYSDWKQTGGNGSWKFGGNLKPTNTGKPPIKSVKNFEPFTQSALKHIQPPVDSNALPNGEKVPEDSSSQAALNKLVQAILSDKKPDEVPTLVESMIAKVTEEFERRLATQGEQFTMVLKDLIASEDKKSLPKSKVLEALQTVSGEHTVNAREDEKQQTNGDPKGQNERYFSDSSNDVDEYGKTLPHLQMHFSLQQKEIEELKYMLHSTREGMQLMQMEWNDEMYNIEKYVRGLAKAASGYHKVLEENRQLYNQVQDLKGSIRVYCRVRPFLPGQAHGQSAVDYIGEDGNLTIVNPAKQGKDSRRTFAFNKVFKSASTQEEVFLDTRPLIRSVLDGYNVCIFAYGQTGSGKTYTMAGPKVVTEENWGVNYRALNDLFQISEQRKDVFTYDVAVQMIEIYNEQVRDLLTSDGSNKKYPFCYP
ncbi:hypothetical protein SUGI_0115490 [Cryptomeria japonica]|nr:hypothetical protein SUGI_0115490 [Cryptomeria japonica]